MSKVRPVEIGLPEQASRQARAAISERQVPRVAAAFRAMRGDGDGELDDVYVADCLADYARQITLTHERDAALSAAVEKAERDVDAMLEEW